MALDSHLLDKFRGGAFCQFRWWGILSVPVVEHFVSSGGAAFCQSRWWGILSVPVVGHFVSPGGGHILSVPVVGHFVSPGSGAFTKNIAPTI